MLDRVGERARESGLDERIRLHRTGRNKIGLNEKVDFILAFYLLHELPDMKAFLREARSLLKPGGHLFIAEPNFKVSEEAFDGTVTQAMDAGFEIAERPRVLFSRAAVFSVR